MSPLASPPSGGDTPARRRTRLLALLSERALTLGDFTLASGRRSRYYLDARLVTLHAEGAYLVARAILDRLAHERVEADAIGGLTMGADPIAGAVAAVSHLVGKDLQAFIVRKTAKEHGTRRRIEGDLERGDRVVVVDDVVTTAGSTLRAIRAVEQVGCRVVAVVCLVDRQEGARERLKDYPFYPLFEVTDLLEKEPPPR